MDVHQVRRAAIALAREIERRAGGRVTTAWWKEQRGEQVFVDYNQNPATARSPRPTRRAGRRRDGVDAVRWTSCADAVPDDFTIATVPALFARRGDPMAGPRRRRAPLEPLLELAERDEAGGLGDLPYPPNYPKMPGEPKRVMPSRSRPDTEGIAPPVGQGLPDVD